MAPTRRLASADVSAIGLGCMSLSHAYGAPPPPAEAAALLLKAVDLGCTFFDTAALYGFGANEALIGETLFRRRRDVFLASKCGMTGVDGKRVIDGRPETLKRTCEESLRRLRTDSIDLYYLHRWDKKVPIEDSVGALADLAQAGKIRNIGLSEVSAATLRKAHAVHPIAAVQSEYSLWSRNPEAAVLDACRELGTVFVAFSPMARGFLTDAPPILETLEPGDIRRFMPRFQGDHYAANRKLWEGFKALAKEQGCTLAQLSLGWVLSKGSAIIPIPGTTKLDHLEENLAAASLSLSQQMIGRLDALINHKTVSGPRYNVATQVEIDTEELT